MGHRLGTAAKKSTAAKATQPKKKTTKKTTSKKASKKTGSKNSALKKAPTNYLHLIIDYLADGISAVEKRVQKEGIKASVVRRAAEELKKSHPDNADLFVAWLDKNYPDTIRGKEPPKAGEIRDYKAQQVKKGVPFLRLNLSVLGIKKGEGVRVEFDNDKYVVYKTPA